MGFKARRCILLFREVNTVRYALGIMMFFLLGTGLALGHQGRITDLKAVPPDHQVETVGYCKGVYHLKVKDGSTFEFQEFNLRFKTDSGPNGPHPGAPVLVPAGMRGDRAFLVFAEPDEMRVVLKTTC